MRLFKKLGAQNGFDAPAFDPEIYYPAIRGSICTGERVAGFKHKKSGKFTEVMLIRSDRDLQELKAKYRVDSVKTEY